MFKKISLLTAIAAGCFLFHNCGGDDAIDMAPFLNQDPDECNMEVPTVTSNSPVTSGSTIELETPFLSTMAQYYWTGPNGFVSQQQNPTVMASALSAGTYTLIIAEGECSSPAATITVAVNDAVAPCNPTNNTATNSLYPNQTFNSVLANVQQDQYQINAGGSQGDLTIIFADEATPTAGVYAVCPDCPTSFMEANEVCVSIVTGGTFSDYFRASTGSVYVSYVNGHITATFCSLSFNGSSSGNSFVASAKITAAN